MTVKAGGALSVAGTGAAAAARDALGATINLAGRSVSLDTTVALPSGKLSIKADDNIALGAGSRIDLAGREVRLFDQLRYSWGGDLELQSMAGDITQAKGALIDVSARNNRAGRVQAIALGDSAGRIDLAAPCAPRPPAAMTRAARWCRMKAAKPCCARRRWPTSAS